VCTPRILLAGTLSFTVFTVGCAGPRYRYATPPVVSESERKACDEFARQTVEKAVAAQKAATRASRHWDANDVGWAVPFVVALPVLVPAFAAPEVRRTTGLFRRQPPKSFFSDSRNPPTSGPCSSPEETRWYSSMSSRCFPVSFRGTSTTTV
jgi:hypothetical protein